MPLLPSDQEVALHFGAQSFASFKVSRVAAAEESEWKSAAKQKGATVSGRISGILGFSWICGCCLCCPVLCSSCFRCCVCFCIWFWFCVLLCELSSLQFWRWFYFPGQDHPICAASFSLARFMSGGNWIVSGIEQWLLMLHSAPLRSARLAKPPITLTPRKQPQKFNSESIVHSSWGFLVALTMRVNVHKIPQYS